MSNPAAAAQRIIAKSATGSVMLKRQTLGAPDPDTPWTPGASTIDVFALDAVVKGVAAEFVDGTTIVAADLMAVASPLARHALSGGEPADGAVIDIVPTMSDTLVIDGQEKVIKRVQPCPAAGPAALFRIFVGS